MIMLLYTTGKIPPEMAFLMINGRSYLPPEKTVSEEDVKKFNKGVEVINDEVSESLLNMWSQGK